MLANRTRDDLRDVRGPALVGGLAVAALLVLVGYSRALRGEFLLDDLPELVDNPAVRDLGTFAHPGTWAVGVGRPLTHLTFAVQYQFAKLDPLPYHALNVALHFATTLLLYLLGRCALEAIGWPRPRAVALVAAGIFAIHPIQTEVVSYTAQRAEGLAALLSVAAVLLLRYSKIPGRALRGALLTVAGAAAFLLGLLAKPTAAVVPLLFVTCEVLFQPPKAPRGLPARRLGLALLLTAVSAWAAIAGVGATARSVSAGFRMPDVRPAAYFLTQSRVLFRYLALLAWPAGQNVDPDLRWSTSVHDPAVLVAIPGLAAVFVAVAFAIRVSRREGASERALAGRVVAFGALWFVIALLPSSAVPLLDAMAEHRAYLGSWGIFLAAAIAADLALRRMTTNPVVSAAVVLPAWIGLTLALYARNAVWETDLALWTDAVAKSPAKARPHANLGYALGVRGRNAEAVAELQAALRAGGLTLFEAPVRNNLAIALIDEGRIEDARLQAERALAIDPLNAASHNTLGEVLFALGDLPAATEQFSRAADLMPAVPVFRSNVARTLERLGRRGEACAAWTRYVDVESSSSDVARARAHMRDLGCMTPFSQ